MGSFRKLLLVGVGVLALHGAQACASDTELNPQPLPPGGEPARSPGSVDDGESDETGNMGGSGGPAPAAPDGGADGGTDGGGASDGGVD